MPKTLCFFNVFGLASFFLPIGFGGLKMAPMWLVLGPLGLNMAPRWRQDGPKMAPEGAKMGPRRRQEGSQQGGPNWHHALFWPLGFQDAPRLPLEYPRRSPRGPKRTPRGLQEPPKRAQEGPKRASIGSQEGYIYDIRSYNTTYGIPRRPSNRLFPNSNLHHFEV